MLHKKKTMDSCVTLCWKNRCLKWQKELLDGKWQQQNLQGSTRVAQDAAAFLRTSDRDEMA